MRITFVLPHLRLSGGVRVVLEVADELHRLGHDVMLVHPWRMNHVEPAWKSYLRAWKYRATRGSEGQCSWFPTRCRVLHVPSLAPAYVPSSDAVIATSWQTAEWVNQYSASHGRKFYLVQHYEIWDGPAARVNATYRMPLTKIVVSSWLKRVVQEQFREDAIGPLVSGVRHDQFHNDSKTLHSPRRLGMLFHRFEWKGMADGLKAVETVTHSHPDVTLVMFGRMRWNADTQHTFPCRTEMYNDPAQDKLRDIYSSCDIWICPSHNEGGPPLPSQEAAACRCAVVTTDVGAARDVFRHGQSALISPPRRPEVLAENICRLLDDDAELWRFSHAAYDSVARCTWSRFARQFERALAGREIADSDQAHEAHGARLHSQPEDEPKAVQA